MRRTSISIPDDLRRQAKEAGLNISKIARIAIAEELGRLDKIAAVDRYLAEMDVEFGPISPEDEAWASARVERLLGPGRD